MSTAAVRDSLVGRARPTSLGDELVGAAFQSCPTALVVVDEGRSVLSANVAFSKLVGLEDATPVGRLLDNYVGRDDVASVALCMEDVVGLADRTASCALTLRCGIEATLAATWFATPSVPSAVVLSLRRSAGRSADSDLAYQAFHDPLTGLANRTLFERRLEEAVQRVREGGRGGALLLVDLDDFKGVNDTLGHHTGDELLVAFAERLRSVTRESDTLCRFGGDEFLVLAEDLDERDIEPMVRRVMSALEEPFTLAGTSVSQSASTGVVPLDASFPARSLVESADIAMYEAKRAGKGRSALFGQHMRERAVLRFELAQEIRPAMASGEMSLHYQPLVDVATRTVVGFEALMRWPHPRHGMVDPTTFIALAEQSGAITELGQLALRQACRALVGLTPELSGRAPYVAVNVSALQFYDRSFPRFVESVLTATGLPGNRLVLEVTETGALGDLDVSAETIRRLERLGVATAIDDFGTGYSALSYLPRLTPSIIKIDRSFVSGAPASADQIAMLRAVVDLSHTMGARVVAEGVETEEELSLLGELGCELAQGFLFSPAVPVHDVPALVERIDACAPGTSRGEQT